MIAGPAAPAPGSLLADLQHLPGLVGDGARSIWTSALLMEGHLADHQPTWDSSVTGFGFLLSEPEDVRRPPAPVHRSGEARQVQLRRLSGCGVGRDMNTSSNNGLISKPRLRVETRAFRFLSTALKNGQQRAAAAADEASSTLPQQSPASSRFFRTL